MKHEAQITIKARMVEESTPDYGQPVEMEESTLSGDYVTYCNKCGDEVARKYGVEPDEILEENSECILCGEAKACPECSHEQDERFGDFPLMVCMDCIAEADRYLSGIAEVNQDINSTLRLREGQGWTPAHLVIDATLHDGGLHPVPLKPGLKLELEPVPMIFAVAVVSTNGSHTQVDFVELCPVSIRNCLAKALQQQCSINGIPVKPETLRAEGNA